MRIGLVSSFMKDTVPTKDEDSKQRLAKRIAHAGVCSRRAAETYILEGRVKINDTVVKNVATTVTDDDKVSVDGKILAVDNKTPRVFLYHKPTGFMTTNNDPQGRKTIFDDLPKNLPRLITVGRLDINTEGLLVLTNNGDLARTLELPTTGIARHYRVRVHGKINEARFESLKNGVTIDGVRYRPIHIEIESRGPTNHWLNVEIHEGKNREVRKVMAHLGFDVNRLIREGFGPFRLSGIPKSAVIEVPTKILKSKLKGLI